MLRGSFRQPQSQSYKIPHSSLPQRRQSNFQHKTLPIHAPIQDFGVDLRRKHSWRNLSQIDRPPPPGCSPSEGRDRLTTPTTWPVRSITGPPLMPPRHSPWISRVGHARDVDTPLRVSLWMAGTELSTRLATPLCSEPNGCNRLLKMAANV